MPDLFVVWVPGTPQPQGSIAYKGRSRAGKPILTSANPTLKPWRQMITWLVQSKLQHKPFPPAAAVSIEIAFTFPRPKGHFGTKGNVLPSAAGAHLVKPDLDKLCRAVLDGLTDAGLFRDDSQVVRLLASKSYSITSPGAAITVREVQLPQTTVTPGDSAHGNTPAGLR